MSVLEVQPEVAADLALLAMTDHPEGIQLLARLSCLPAMAVAADVVGLSLLPQVVVAAEVEQEVRAVQGQHRVVQVVRPAHLV